MPMKSLPLSRGYFTPMQLDAATRLIYEDMAHSMLARALNRLQTERQHSQHVDDATWRSIGTSSGFRRYVKVDGANQHYRLQGTIDATISRVMDVLFAGGNTQLLARRKILYNDCLDAQMLGMISKRGTCSLDTTQTKKHQQYQAIQWQAINISAGTNLTDSFNCDLCVLEYTGYASDSEGSLIGFMIYQSVNVAACPSLLHTHGLTRIQGMEMVLVQQSSSKSKNREGVEVFIEGVADIARAIPPYVVNTYLATLAGRWSNLSAIIQDYYVSTVVLCDTSKFIPLSNRQYCAVCRSKFGLLAKKSHCHGCGDVVCKSCVCKRRSRRENVKICSNCIIAVMEQLKNKSKKEEEEILENNDIETVDTSKMYRQNEPSSFRSRGIRNSRRYSTSSTNSSASSRLDAVEGNLAQQRHILKEMASQLRAHRATDYSSQTMQDDSQYEQ